MGPVSFTIIGLNDRVSCFPSAAQVNDEYSSLVVAQLLFLQSEDHKKPIQMYINSPGE